MNQGDERGQSREPLASWRFAFSEANRMVVRWLAREDHTQGWPTPGIRALGLGGGWGGAVSLVTWKRLRSGLPGFLVFRD